MQAQEGGVGAGAGMGSPYLSASLLRTEGHSRGSGASAPDFVSWDGTCHYNQTYNRSSSSTSSTSSRDSSPGRASSSSSSDEEWRGREITLPSGQRVFILHSAVNCERRLKQYLTAQGSL